MKLALMDIDKFIQANSLQEVTNPILMDRGYHPTVDGILSTDIFGSTTEARRTTFAYINLYTHLLQPLAYKTLQRLDRRIDDIISGVKNFVISKTGELVEDNEKGDTGIEWLYNNWDKLKFKKNESNIRSSRIKFITLHSKKELFQTKEIVIPAFYRDINLQSGKRGKPSTHQMNKLYCRLIRLADMLNHGDFAFNLNYNRFQMQKTLVEIYDEFKNRLEKKRGIVKQNILGKSVDYGARLVISNARFMAERPGDMIVDFEHVGIPLSYSISLFTPFVIGWIQNFFRREFDLNGGKYPVYHKGSNEIEYVQLKDPMAQFSEDAIKELMNTYIHSHAQRFDPIYIETEEGKKVPLAFTGLDISGGKGAEQLAQEKGKAMRPMTLTDLFYIAMNDITHDKHVYITRYPMSDYMGIYPCGIALLSTNETVEMKYGDVVYKHYPKVDMTVPKHKISTLFPEIINMQNTYLQSLNGDYDGDQISVKGVFSQEANKEAHEKMKATCNFMSINGVNSRTTTIEAIQCCWSVTRWKNPNETW